MSVEGVAYNGNAKLIPLAGEFSNTLIPPSYVCLWGCSNRLRTYEMFLSGIWFTSKGRRNPEELGVMFVLELAENSNRKDWTTRPAAPPRWRLEVCVVGELVQKQKK